nr:hypothetical protein [Pandoravirus aubagnensis]
MPLFGASTWQLAWHHCHAAARRRANAAAVATACACALFAPPCLWAGGTYVLFFSIYFFMSERKETGGPLFSLFGLARVAAIFFAFLDGCACALSRSGSGFLPKKERERERECSRHRHFSTCVCALVPSTGREEDKMERTRPSQTSFSCLWRLANFFLKLLSLLFVLCMCAPSLLLSVNILSFCFSNPACTKAHRA